MKVGALIIDPQNDFVYPGIENIKDNNIPDDIMDSIKDYMPEYIVKEGSLLVPGGYDDMVRVAKMIETEGHKFDDIFVTLDTHHYLDIAHPVFWMSGDGKTNPTPFTIITKADVENGVWRASIPFFQQHCLDYVTQLEDNGRYPLCIWPVHCAIGTFGHNVVEPLKVALALWEKKRKGYVDYVTKGSNFKSEHYSAVKADVPDPSDSSTNLNHKLITALKEFDIIAIAGEARSHCVANTIRDIAAEFGDEHVKKMVLLEDAMSDVPGFENLGNDFMEDMIKLGVKVKTTETLFK